MNFKNWKNKRRLIKILDWEAFNKEIQAAHEEAAIPNIQKLAEDTKNLITEIEKEIAPLTESHKREDRERVKQLEKEKGEVSKSIENYEKAIPAIQENIKRARQEAESLRTKIEFIKKWKSS